MHLTVWIDCEENSAKIYRMQLKKDGNTTTVVVAEQDEAADATAATVSATSCQYIHKIIS